MNQLKSMLLLCILSPFFLTACHHKTPNTPSNNTNSQRAQQAAQIRATANNPAGFSQFNHLESSRALIQKINNNDMQFINEGHRMTVLIPTDKYYVFGTNRLNEFRYGALNDVLKLLKCFPGQRINVAGFTDNVGSEKFKKSLSQERAQAMVAYFWASGIPEARLNAQGYGDKHNIANNKLIHGSALNRRIEIQWTA